GGAAGAEARLPLDPSTPTLPPERLLTAQAAASGRRATSLVQLGDEGNRRVVSVEATPIADSTGRPAGVVTLYRDLTARRELERRLAEASAELRARTELVEALFAHLPAGLALLQGPDLRLRAANRRLFELAGVADTPAAGRRLADLLPPATAAQVAEWIARARATGQAVRGTNVRVEGTRRGQAYWSYAVAPLGEFGRRTDTLLLAVTDTTEEASARVLAQRAAEQIEQKGAELEAVLQALADGIVLLDGSGRVVALNRAAEQLLGRPAEQGVRPRLEDFPLFGRLYEPNGRLLAAAELAATGAAAPGAEGVVRREAYLLTEAHEKRFLSLSATPLRDRRGRLLGTAVTFRDITREKEIESFKLQFIARAAHELRTPLTTIKGNLLLTLKGRFGTLAPHQREALETATRNVDTMVALIDDLLDITRIQTGRLRLFGQEVSLAALLERSLERVAPLAANKRIALSYDRPHGIVGYWDAAKIEQVFGNVLSNAVKFTPPGGRVDVRVYRDGPSVTVVVRDTGIGIPRENLSLVFQPFVSIPRQEVGGARQRGTGLGLSVAQSIVEAHGGRMWAESDGVGRGTSVYFTLPLDHRRSARVPVNLPARVRAGEQPIEPSVVADLSADGVSIVAPTEVLVATLVTVEIPLPAGPALTATGEIVRVEPLADSQFKAGVRFRGLAEADRALIHDWIRRCQEAAGGGRPGRPPLAPPG
ncbi:MAG TPA: PAS domain-containing protein, partial [Thermodesulfobacteriota bacterium]|nr:PAS domain-containing protein [Thermodesulfobacteriota bacterium]